MAELRNRIKFFRVQRELSQEELAKLVGVRRETIVHLEAERYNPSFKLAYDLARVFQVSLEELFWYE